MLELDMYIWYASYGSNLSKDRFECYIKGGMPIGSAKYYNGCSDKTLPVKQFVFTTPRELYFAKSSRAWGNGGVCFISTNEVKHNLTICRAYLITKEQFIEVAIQESQSLREEDFNFIKCYEDVHLKMNPKAWYGMLVFLGINESFPIFTFTSCENLDTEINKPSDNYLFTIISGLKELNYRNEDIVKYLGSKQGIREYFSKARITSLVEKKK